MIKLFLFCMLAALFSACGILPSVSSVSSVPGGSVFPDSEVRAGTSDRECIHQSAPGASPEENPAGVRTLSEPPNLTLVCGIYSASGSRSSYSWTTPEMAVYACGVHPIQMMREMTPLPVSDTCMVSLNFEIMPDQVSVSRWPESIAWSAEDPEAFRTLLGQAEIVPVESGMISVDPDYSFVYEVSAAWDPDSGCGGTARYRFRTVPVSSETPVYADSD